MACSCGRFLSAYTQKSSTIFIKNLHAILSFQGKSDIHRSNLFSHSEIGKSLLIKIQTPKSECSRPQPKESFLQGQQNYIIANSLQELIRKRINKLNDKDSGDEIALRNRLAKFGNSYTPPPPPQTTPPRLRTRSYGSNFCCFGQLRSFYAQYLSRKNRMKICTLGGPQSETVRFENKTFITLNCNK